MKRLLTALLLMALMVPVAITSKADDTPQTTFLAMDGIGSYRYIHQYIAPNGQQLYFTASTKQPRITFDDVNFDGQDDIVVRLNAETSDAYGNAYYTFFVYDEAKETYYRVDCEHSDTGFANYKLHPELGILEAYGARISADVEHEYLLFTWENGWPKHLRSAIVVNPKEYSSAEGGSTVTTWHNCIRIVVYDYTGDESVKLFEETVTRADAEQRDIFNEEQAALWQGLK